MFCYSYSEDFWETGSEVYMAYVTCYSIALINYDLERNMFSEAIEKWLPPPDYVNKALLCLELIANGMHYDRTDFNV